LPQILIIDDDPGLLNVCRVGLEALGCLVRTAETANEGLTEAAIRTPDVIVLDLGLPDLDGLELCRRIRTWSDVPSSCCPRTAPKTARSKRWMAVPITT
jgi:two-component system, OmpR family, KDP operon response regulator KdpE